MPVRRFSLMASLTLVALAATNQRAEAQGGNKQVFNPPNARPGGVLSSAVRVGDLVFLSGALGTKPGGGGLAERGVVGVDGRQAQAGPFKIRSLISRDAGHATDAHIARPAACARWARSAGRP